MQIYWNSNKKYVVLMNSLKERIGVGDSSSPQICFRRLKFIFAIDSMWRTLFQEWFSCYSKVSKGGNVETRILKKQSNCKNDKSRGVGGINLANNKYFSLKVQSAQWISLDSLL